MVISRPTLSAVQTSLQGWQNFGMPKHFPLNRSGKQDPRIEPEMNPVDLILTMQPRSSSHLWTHLAFLGTPENGGRVGLVVVIVITLGGLGVCCSCCVDTRLGAPVGKLGGRLCGGRIVRG